MSEEPPPEYKLHEKDRAELVRLYNKRDAADRELQARMAAFILEYNVPWPGPNLDLSTGLFTEKRPTASPQPLPSMPPM